MGEDQPPTDPDNPFDGIPFWGDLGSLFPAQIDIWASARQIAAQIATDGSAEKNVDPAERVTLEHLTRAAELHVAKVTGLEPTAKGVAPKLELVIRSQWANDALKRCQPLLEHAAKRLDPNAGTASGDSNAGGDAVEDNEIETDTPEINMFAAQGNKIFEQLMKHMSPVLIGICAGTMTGNLAKSAFGDYGLLLPSDSDTINLIGPNIADFAKEWNLDISGVLLWVSIRQMALHAVFSVPHVRADINQLLERYADGFLYDPAALQRQLEEQIEQNPDLSDGAPDQALIQFEMQKALGKPELLLGAGRSEDQAAIAEELGIRLALIDAYVNHVLEAAGRRLITSYDALTEALRRRQPMNSTAEKFVSLLLGASIDNKQAKQAGEFVNGVDERAGDEGLALLWSDPSHWPTPNEIVAPGLWLARIELLGNEADGGEADSAGEAS